MNAGAGDAHRPLTDLDWQVVEIARREKPDAIGAEHRIVGLLRALFSRPVAPALANGKLEALRRFCMHAWHRDIVPADHAKVLISVGYSATNISEIMRYVAGLRGFLPMLEGASSAEIATGGPSRPGSAFGTYSVRASLERPAGNPKYKTHRC